MTHPAPSSKAPAGMYQALVRSPVLWGALAAGGFYALVGFGVLRGWFIERYFASHPVEYVMTTMFFIGMAALAIKALDIVRQHEGLAKPLLTPIPPGGQPVVDCQSLAARLDRLPPKRRDSYRVGRLRDALEHVRRTGSAHDLEDQLKYLADLDADRAHASYGLVRVIIWAIPILGFLGTVIGITMALGRLAPQALETSLPAVMTALAVAFNTTIQALGLSIVLMFAQYFTDRKENALLAQVDRRVEEELAGRFERIHEGPDGQLVAVRRMIESLIDSNDQVVQRQAELWQGSIEAAQKRWSTMADTAAAALQAALAGALAESLEVHAQALAAAEQAAGEKNRQTWLHVQQSLARHTESADQLHQTMLREAEVLGRAIEATDQISNLQNTLNANLKTLAGARNFEQTVISLAAAIQLLTARLAELPTDASHVQLELERTSQSGQAA